MTRNVHERAGNVVARGKIRVDARKAVAKLREHLLVDLHDYLLEVARAGVASGADRLDVGYDADDVTLSWNGRPIAAETVARLLDHALIEASDAESQRLRLLAFGVNAALGLDPTWVDVYTVSATGCMRLRWKPSMLAEGAEEDPEALEVTVPAGLQPGGIRVHLRRRVGWGVLRSAALGGTPREVEALMRAARDLPIPLQVHGDVWAQGEPHPALLRVALDMPPDADAPRSGKAFGGRRRGLIELRACGYGRAHIDFLEQGVRLASYNFEPSKYQLVEKWGCTLDVRVVIDADVLPTNASRSAVREDAPLFSQALAAANAGFHQLVNWLQHAVLGMGKPVAEVTRCDAAGDRQLDDALGALTCMALAAGDQPKLSDETNALMATPVLRDGCGDPLSYVDLRLRDSGFKFYALFGAQPAPRAIEHWMRNVLWVDKTRVAVRALDGIELADATHVVAQAGEALLRRNQLMAHAPTTVAVAFSPSHLVREAFSVEQGAFKGLRGEIALRGSGPAGCSVRVFLEGRELAVRHLPPEMVPLPLDVAIEWDRLSVTFGYDDVVDGTTLRSAIWYAVTVGIMQANDLALQLEPLDVLAAPPSPAEAQKIRATVRSALGAAALTRKALSLPASYEPPRARALDDASVWPTTDDRFVSMVMLRHEVGQRGCVCLATPRCVGRAVDGRIVLRLPADQRVWLEASLGDVPYLDYDAGVLDPPALANWPQRRAIALRRLLDEELAQQGVSTRCAMAFQREGVVGWAAVAEKPVAIWSHLGRKLCSEPLARSFGHALVVADDDGIVPNASWSGYQWRDTSWSHDQVEKELFIQLVAAYEGDRFAIERMAEGFESDLRRAHPMVRNYLLRGTLALREALLRSNDATVHAELEPLLQRTCALPLVLMCGEDGRAAWSTLAAVAAAHEGRAAVTWLSREPGFETWDWWPLIVGDAMERLLLREYFEPRLISGDDDVPARRARAADERARRQVLARAAIDPLDLGDMAPATAPRGHMTDVVGTAVVALAASAPADGRPLCDVAYQCRPIARVALDGLPMAIVGRVNLEDADCFVAFHSLSVRGLETVARLAGQAASHLLTKLIQEAADDEALPSPMLDARVLATLRVVLRERERLPVDALGLRNALRYKARYPTVQGEQKPLKSLRREGSIQMGRTRFEPWIGPKGARSSLDQPILWLSSDYIGESFQEIFRDLDIQLVDLTVPLGQLQARRGGGVSSEVPRLPGTPIHRALRGSVGELGDGSLDGEIELLAGDRSELIVIDVGGAGRTVPFTAPYAVRALVRSDEIAGGDADTRIAQRVQRVADKLLMRTVPLLEELPEWVRYGVRALMSHKLGLQHQLTKAMQSARVFGDIAGQWHSLASLREQHKSGRVWATRSPPPHPQADYGRVVACLDEASIARFAAELQIDDVTETVQRDQSAEARKSAVPRIAFELGAVRPSCLWTRTVQEKGMRGELGVLQPEHETLRGIALHLEGRPLCNLSDGEGWPIAAVVDVDDLEPNRFFDGLRTKADEARVASRLEAIADKVMAGALLAPSSAAAEHWLNVRVLDSDGGRTCIVGRFWLAGMFPSDPMVQVRAPDILGGAMKVRLRRLFGISGMDLSLPVFGSLMVLPSSPNADMHHLLSDQALDAAQAMLGSLAGRASAEATGMMRWNLSLLGAEVDPAPSAATVDGRRVGPTEVKEELSARRKLWFSERRGSADGAFPTDAPGFVLLAGEDDGLLALLGLRGPLLLSELGGVAKVHARPRQLRDIEDTPQPDTFPDAVHVVLEDDLSATVDSILEGSPRPAEEEIVESWWGGLTRTLFGPSEQAPVTRTLRETLEAAAKQLLLSGSPIAELRFSRSGRPVRFERKQARVIVNRDHPSLVRLLTGDEPDRAAIRLLMAAVVSELNRAGLVTAAGEREALLGLLEASPR